MNIKDSVIWITGGTSGIGKGCDEHFVALGAKVAISGRCDERGNKIVSDLGENCVYFHGDVTKSEENFSVANAIIEKWGRIDILINMAGYPHIFSIFDENGELNPIDPFIADITTDLIGTYDTTRIAAYHMKKNSPNEIGERGCIINCGSLAAFSGDASVLYGYKTAKEGVKALARCFAPALAPFGIRVNTVHPGFIRSGITENPETNLGIPPESNPFPANLFPNVIGEPEHIAKICEAIIVNEYINCADFCVDAGSRSRY